MLMRLCGGREESQRIDCEILEAITTPTEEPENTERRPRDVSSTNNR